MGIWSDWKQAAVVALVGLAAWAVLLGMVAFAAHLMSWRPWPVVGWTAAGIGAGVLLARVRRRRQLRELERRAGYPRRKRRAAHRAGGRAVWRVTRGRLG